MIGSKFYETPLASDEILASIFGHFSFELESIERMRKRQSKSGLYEAVVFLRRSWPARLWGSSNGRASGSRA